MLVSSDMLSFWQRGCSSPLLEDRTSRYIGFRLQLWLFHGLWFAHSSPNWEVFLHPPFELGIHLHSIRCGSQPSCYSVDEGTKWVRKLCCHSPLVAMKCAQQIFLYDAMQCISLWIFGMKSLISVCILDIWKNDIALAHYFLLIYASDMCSLICFADTIG